LKILDLFSGIGGFSLGLESTGYFKTIAFVEKDPFCQKVLSKNFPNIPIEGEIRNVKGSRYDADVITGGFPCQPFSIAGQRKGTDDDRYLWDETIRVIRECQPRWFIGENVEGIVSIQQGMVLRQVQDDLEEEGFEVQCLSIPASGIGAWHHRKRVWIIAQNVSDTNSKQNNTRYETTVDKTEQNRMDSNEKGNWNKIWSFSSRCPVLSGNVPNTTVEGSQGNVIQPNMETEERQVAAERSSEEQYTWWQNESKLCGVPNGISYGLDKHRSKRIKALGNSVVPQIIREIGIAILKAEELL
jgi:DNA (cytosine-5)-methyltransferase 1